MGAGVEARQRTKTCKAESEARKAAHDSARCELDAKRPGYPGTLNLRRSVSFKASRRPFVAPMDLGSEPAAHIRTPLVWETVLPYAARELA
jgi:hypothetical protein